MLGPLRVDRDGTNLTAVVESTLVDVAERCPPRRSFLDGLLPHSLYHLIGEVLGVELRPSTSAKTSKGRGYFVPVSMIDRAARFAADELQADNYMRGMDRVTFIARLAHHYDQFNYIRPFREGNGRTQRWMWDRIARDAGWRLSWLGVTGAVNDAASRIAADDQDLAPLIAMLNRAVTR